MRFTFPRVVSVYWRILGLAPGVWFGLRRHYTEKVYRGLWSTNMLGMLIQDNIINEVCFWKIVLYARDVSTRLYCMLGMFLQDNIVY